MKDKVVEPKNTSNEVEHYNIQVIKQHNDISASYKESLDLLSSQIQVISKAWIQKYPEKEGAEWYQQGLVTHGNLEMLYKMGVGKDYTPAYLRKQLKMLMNTNKLISDSVICPPGEPSTALIVKSYMFSNRDGDFYLVWNSTEEKRLIDMNGRYNCLEPGKVTELKTPFSVNLYQYLNSEFNERLAKERDSGLADVEYEIILHVLQFRLLIGIELSFKDNDAFMNELKKKEPDFDKLDEMLTGKKRKYPEWDGLYRYVVVPTVEEINSLEEPDFSVGVEPIKVGQSHKTKYVKIKLKRRTDTKKYRDTVCAAQLQEYCDWNIDREQARALIEVAEGDLAVVKKAYDKIVKNHGKVDKYFPYMKKMIVEGFVPCADDEEDTGIRLIKETHEQAVKRRAKEREDLK